MVKMNISKAKDELYEIAHSCIKHNDVFNIATEEGNIVMLSEDNYNSLVESLYLTGIKGVYEDIEEVVNTPSEELCSELL